jgi:hypothetical protein
MTIPIALSQLVLWYNAPRIQSWPELLAAIPLDTCLKSPVEFGRRFQTARMTDMRHAAAEKIARNLPGLERTPAKIALKGLGLLEKCPAGYRLSNAGLTLAEGYRQDPGGNGWVKYLAQLLLEREPRCRALISALSEPGSRIVFPGTWFVAGCRKAVVEDGAGRKMMPFWDEPDKARSLRQILQENAWWCLGEWRGHPLIDGHTDCIFTGQLKPEFSLHDIGLAMHAACEVFLQIGLIKYQGRECLLDCDVAVNLFSQSLCDDFAWQTDGQVREDLRQLLAEILPQLRSDTGFIVAEELRKALAGKRIFDPDRQIAALEQKGQIIVYAEDYGQSRHGDGLYHDPRKQLIKIRLLA